MKDLFVNLILIWEVVKYKDQKSLFDTFTNRKTEYNYGYLKRDVSNSFKTYNSFHLYFSAKPYLMLGVYSFKNDHDEYLLYKRKKISPLDVIANIGALFSTIKTFF